MRSDVFRTEAPGVARLSLEVAASELEGALTGAAQLGRLVTYTDAAAAIKSAPLNARSVELVRLLCNQMTADVETDSPLLSSLVIGHLSNRPGKGFFRFARQFFRIDDEEVFWLKEVEAAHAYYSPRARRRGVAPEIGHRVLIRSPQDEVDMDETEFILSFFD